MRLANLNEFRRIFFTPESAPSTCTLRRRIEKEEIPGGQIICGRYYVDLDEYDRALNVRKGLAARQSALASHPLLEGLV